MAQVRFKYMVLEGNDSKEKVGAAQFAYTSATTEGKRESYNVPMLSP